MKIPWVQTIPDHWEIHKAKNMFIKQNRSVHEDDEVVTCFRDGMVTLRKNRRVTGFTESTQWSGYQGVRKGDLVIHIMDAFAGSMGVSDSDGKSTPVYNVCTAKIDLNNYYYAYLLREMARAGYIQSLNRGIRERSSDFRFEVFAGLFLPIPPRCEQDQIVRYLNWKVSQINKLINAKRQQIKLLREYSLACINDAISLGAPKSTHNKDSKIPWIDNLPNNWKTSIIKKHFCIEKRIAKKEGYDVISITQKGLKIKDISINEGQMAVNYSNYQFVNPGDYAMNHMDLLTGYIDISKYHGVTSPDYRVFCLTDKENCMSEYYLRVFQVCYKRKIFYGYGRGAASHGRWRLPKVNFLNFQIPLPPINEQRIIANYCHHVETTIQNAVTALDNEIGLLSEYRTRLISEVVTGKRDVRDIVVPEYETVEEPVDDIIMGDNENEEAEE